MKGFIASILITSVSLLAFAAGPIITPEPTNEYLINQFMTRPNGLTANFSSNQVDQDYWLNLMVEISSNYNLSIQVDMEDVALSASNQVNLDLAGGTYIFTDGDQTQRATTPDTVGGFMTAPEEESFYFCLRADGDESSGALMKGLVNITVNGVSYDNVLVQLRRDGLEQVRQVILSDATSRVSGKDGGGIQQAEEMVWVISWFHDQCTKANNKNCDPSACSLTLAKAIELAKRLGIEIPDGATLEEILELLQDVTLVSGTCDTVYFLGILKIGCQCVYIYFE